MTSHDSHDRQDFSVTEPQSAPTGHASPENVKSDTETLGKGAGGFLGSVGGMSIGALGGPIGIVIGGIAGAVGGWWAGAAIADALTADDETFFRSHYEATPNRSADRAFESARTAYVAGHLAGRNPEYAGRSFEDIEADLQRGWSDDVAAHSGKWPAARGYARVAFDRARKG